MPCSLPHLSGSAVNSIAAIVICLDHDRGPARGLHALHEYAESLPLLIVCPTNLTCSAMNTIDEVYIVHDLSRAELVAIHEYILEPEFQGVHTQLCSEYIHGAFRGPNGLHGSISAEGPVRRQVCVDAEGVDPNLWDTVWPNSSITHLLSDARSTIGIRACIDPADNPFCDQRAISTSPKLHLQRCRVSVDLHHLLVLAELGLHM